jgi:hypothetical protein
LYFNPNISPPEEHDRRFDELKLLASYKDINILGESYDHDSWLNGINGLEDLPENSERCWTCYKIRIEKTFKRASENGAAAVATTLSVSPHKNAERIAEIGSGLEKKYGISFIRDDFKKGHGYQRSIELSKRWGFYRQNYCGCEFSLKKRTCQIQNPVNLPI